MTDLTKMPKAIATAIKDAMGKVKMLGKEDENKFASYKYASIDQFLESLRPKLHEAGMSVVSDETDAVHFTMKEIKKSGESVDSTFVHYSYNFYLAHEEAAETYGPLRRSVDLRFVGPQTSGQAQSYCEKMFLRSLLKVATGEKDADEQEQGEFVGKKPEKKNMMPVSKTGNRAIDDAVKAGLSTVRNCIDKEALDKAAPYQRKYLTNAGATEEQLGMLDDQIENKYLELRAYDPFGF